MLRKVVILVFVNLLLLYSCVPGDSAFFGQKVVLRNDIPISDTLEVEKIIELDYELTQFNISDSILITWYNHDFHFLLNDLKTGELLGGMCRRGRGPDEFISVMPRVDVCDNTVSLIDPIENDYYEIDLASTISKGQTQVLTTIHFESNRPGTIPYANVHKLPERRFMLYDFCYQTENQKTGLVEIPYYAVYDIETGRIQKTIHLGGPRCMRYLEKHTPGHGIMFYPFDCLSTSGDKLAFVLMDFPVYGIIDLNKGEKLIYRISDLPDFEDGVLRRHFSGVCTDGNNIYALYHGRSRPAKDGATSFLYTFNWSGELIKKEVIAGIYNDIHYSDGNLYLSNQTKSYLFRIKLKNQCV
ncbi:MAG: hypothetical protein IJ653_07110 [Bacteroidales bacterium]|nr:hypothetical protein [Bacteroidales bacterium]